MYMPKELNYLDVRYTVFMPTKDIENWLIDEFIVIKHYPCLFDEEYSIAEIECVTLDSEALTADDVMEITGALAVHEEYTNGVLTTPDTIDEIATIYCWSGAGLCFISDMLTEIEKLSLLMRYLYDTYKELIKVEDLMYNVDKDTPYQDLSDNIDVLFSNDINCIRYKDHHPETLWWPYILEACGGFFLIMLGEEEDEDIPVKEPEQLKLLPLANCNPNHDTDPWDDYDDEYSTMTEWYRARGYI